MVPELPRMPGLVHNPTRALLFAKGRAELALRRSSESRLSTRGACIGNPGPLRTRSG